MRALAVFASGAAAVLVGCAEEVPPPPPAEPIVDGQVHSVSRADIRTVVALAKKRLAETGRASHPIYHVHVDRSDMISVSHGRLPTPHDKTEEFLIFDRVKGKWQLRDIEIVRGFNIPTG
jgi:hypothetical protein